MALDKVLIIYDEQGNPVDYDILAKDVKFQPDGKDLPTKLAEMEQEIEDAAGGGYAPPAGGIPKSDLASGVQSSLDKADTALQQSDKTELQNEINGKVDAVNGKGLSTNDYTNEDKAAVATIANKANSADVYTKAQTYNKTEVDTMVANKQDNISDLATIRTNAAKGIADVSTPATPDGTAVITLANGDTFTINFNHTHENMAKIVKCTEATRPQTLENDTIYVQVDDVTTPTEIESLWLFGLEFTGDGGDTTPRLSLPIVGSTINIGTNTGSGASESVTVKGKNLTQDLTLELTGTGFAFDSTQANGVTFVSSTELTVSAAAANQTGGVAVEVKYTGTTVNATGQLDISSTGEIDETYPLTASYEVFSQSYSESEAKAAFQDSTLDNKWLKANGVIGSAPQYTNESGSQGCYILKIPLAGIAVLRYPMFMTSSGFGSVICDANGNVVWQFANATCNNGVMNTVDVANIAGASYALIQLYNAVTGYTIEVSSDLYYGITYDKAAVNAGYVDAVGYCVSNGYPLVTGHVYKINAGFTQSPNSNNLFGLKIFGADGSTSRNLYSVDNNQDGNGVMSVTMSSYDQYMKATFKTSELDDCYIYDDTASLYLFKGKNVQ